MILTQALFFTACVLATSYAYVDNVGTYTGSQVEGRDGKIPVYEHWKGDDHESYHQAGNNHQSMDHCEWRYIGCYDMRKGQVGSLTEMVTEIWTADISPKTCTEECKNKGLPVAAVGGAKIKEMYCYCGESFPQQKQQSGCVEPCPENPMEKCGSWNRLNVYKCINPEIKPLRSVCLVWNDLGCYNMEHGSENRLVLKGQAYNIKASNRNLAIKKCRNMCALLGHVLSGYTNANTCLCGAYLHFNPEPAHDCTVRSQSASSVQLSSCHASNFDPFLP